MDIFTSAIKRRF